jgi:hypothetical protein
MDVGNSAVKMTEGCRRGRLILPHREWPGQVLRGIMA